VIDAEVRADVARRRDEGVVAGQDIGDQSVIEVEDWRQRVKRPLVSAPSLPAPVVEGDLPVIEQMNSMKSSGSSM
jgi:hypothetical protein